MNIGFIGAGKVGFSLGKYFTMQGFFVSGYYSRKSESSSEASEFTGTKQYLSINDLVKDSDLIFLTVPDGAIITVWQELKQLPLQGKIICHCSGSLASTVFTGIAATGAYGYSVHPFYAVSDKYHSYKELSDAFFTIEGNPDKIRQIESLLNRCNNRFRVIAAESKTKYHAAAVCISNLMTGLIDMAAELLTECGFSKEEAFSAFTPIVMGNIKNVLEKGPEDALTGPVERCDTETVIRHLNELSNDEREIYRLLSRRLVNIAENKNKSYNYDALKGILE